MPLMQQALLTSSHLLAEQVCQAYTSGRVSTQLAGLLQQLCPSASLCSIALYHEGGKLASVSNLLTAGLAKFSVAPLTSMAAGLAVLQRRWFHASCPSSRPSKYRDLHQAAGKHGCESVVCVPIPVPAAAAPAMGAAHSMGVLTLGVTKSDAVEIRHLSSLLLLAQSLAPHLAAKALPLLHDIGAHLRRPLLRHVRRGPTYNVVDMSGKGAAGPALELLPAAAAQISQQRSEDCCPRQTDANDALEPMVSAPELGSPKADHGMPDGWAKKSPPGSPMPQRARLGVKVVSFKTADETVVVPLDYYKMLQINRVASRDTVSKAYDAMISNPPEGGYSQEALYSRSVVLKAATDILMEPTARRAYDLQVLAGTPQAELLYADLPGALTLMHEAGDLDTVLKWGAAWLRDNAGDKRSKDVALTLAQANCDAAAARLEQDPDDVLPCAELMNSALGLLQQHSVAPEMQAEIAGALEELSPKVAFLQISLPTDAANAEQRAAGLATLSALAWRPGFSFAALNMGRGEFLRAARAQLTAAEQVQLFEAAPEGISIPAEDRYDAAVAYLAEGYRTFNPILIQTAEKLLAHLEEGARGGAAGESGAGEPLDVSVELAVCKLLLGDSEAAEEVLGLDQPGGSAADPSVRDFVMDHSPEADDLLPGLCVLSERWLADVAISGFREMQGAQVSLNTWFENPRVKLYLKVLDNGRRLHLTDAAALAQRGASAVAHNLGALVSGSWGAVWGLVAGSGSSAGDPAAAETRLRPRPTARQSLPPARGAGQAQDLASSSEPVESVDLQKRSTGAAAEDAAPRSDEAESDDDAADAAELVLMPGKARTGPSITDGIVVFEGEREMWMSASSKKRHPTLRALLTGAFLLAAFAVAGVQWKNRHQPVKLPSTAEMAQQESPSQIQKIVRYWQSRSAANYEELTPVEAAGLITTWQSVKADALGPKHNVGRLEEVLEGKLFDEWHRRAVELKEQNWHWSYKLLDLEVDKVETMPDGRRAVLEATLNERAELHNKGEVTDSYSSTYSLEYQLVRRAKGWKLTGSKVIY
ncbi:hypothetical protein WJX72_004490 [[Myrmecia] bisecta]|uniref:ARC6 IMS domain-containing protein n=1 Tax=[Myrmecia] bisecta TaxID=41462 RepID=A0AAW1QEW3_9CHLO